MLWVLRQKGTKVRRHPGLAQSCPEPQTRPARRVVGTLPLTAFPGLQDAKPHIRRKRNHQQLLNTKYSSAHLEMNNGKSLEIFFFDVNGGFGIWKYNKMN